MLGGNRLLEFDHLIERTNPATERLLDPVQLLARLDAMASGLAEAELPSCNLLLTSSATIS